MTEPITYNDLAAFFRTHYGSQCETLTKIDPVYDFMDEPIEVEYLECTTSVYNLSTFTITLPSDGINSFADLFCLPRDFSSSENAIYCESVSGDPWNPRESGFEMVLKKSDAGVLNAIGGFIFTESPSDIYERPRKVLDFLGSVDFGWYWVAGHGTLYTREDFGWYIL